MKKIKMTLRKKETVLTGLFIILLFVVVLISLIMGRYQIPLDDMLQTIKEKMNGSVSEKLKQYETIIFKVRLPRILTALFVGSSLAVSGTAYQSMFRNPMVSPDILGVSAGASFGAAIGIIFQGSYWKIQMLAFIFGLAAVTISYLLGAPSRKSNEGIVVLVLSGLVIRTLFQAFLSIIKYMADPLDALPEITFWLMGSLSSVTLKDALIIGVPTVIGTIILFRCGWKLNIMSFGEEEAAAMGVDTISLRRTIIITSTIMVCISISVCGTIGWIGLIIPHFARMIVGPNNKILLPVSVVLGGTYLLVMDDIARNLLQLEIPISILTSIIGAPVFVLLLNNTRVTSFK